MRRAVSGLSSPGLIVTIFAFVASYFPGVIDTAFAQDELLSEQQGEIILRPQAIPSFSAKPIGPAFKRQKEAATRRKTEEEDRLRALNDALIVSQSKQRKLQKSVADLDQDRNALLGKLISTARLIQETEDVIAANAMRVKELVREENSIKKSLASRRTLLAEVLATLQRMGKNPPPAIVISPSDTLNAVRSAMMLGAILPEIKAEARALLTDLASLSSVIEKMKIEWKVRIRQEKKLSEEQLRLDLLVKENQRLKQKTQRDLTKVRNDNEKLAAEATTLRDLITSLSRDIVETDHAAIAAGAAAKRAAHAEAKAYEVARSEAFSRIMSLQPVEPASEKISASGGAFGAKQSVVLAYNGDTASKLQQLPARERQVVNYASLIDRKRNANSSTSFLKLRGQLDPPVRGVVLRSYGEADGLGGVSKGLTIETKPQTPVIAPADGQVVFAGPFPGFEQLIIVDVGNNYHLIVAGMEKINVTVGDQLVAGQPVARMGGQRSHRLAGLAVDAAQLLEDGFLSGETPPVLYVELRRSGVAINPSVWWKGF